MSYLKINSLSKRYGKHTVLDEISISVEKGEFVVLLGPSGCGKSTLLHCIAGLLKYEDGAIIINDNNMNDIHPSKRDIAMVFQSYALYPNMTVKDNIVFGMKIRKEPKEEIEKKVSEVSEILNISELLNRKPAALSGGQQQRVAIGRALVRNPQIFLFDEPLSNLDAKLREKMRTEIKRLHQRLKNTIIYVTHDQVEAMSLADKIVVMDRGKVIQYGIPTEIYFRPQTLFVAEFIGSPSMNLIACQVTKKNNKYWVTLTNHGKETSFMLSTHNWPKERLLSLETICQDHQNWIMGIRPENIYYSKDVKKELEKYRIPLKVEIVQPIGSDSLVITNLNKKEFIIRLHSDVVLPRENETADFFLDMDKALFYSSQEGKLVF